MTDIAQQLAKHLHEMILGGEDPEEVMNGALQALTYTVLIATGRDLEDDVAAYYELQNELARVIARHVDGEIETIPAGG